jgi:hypothetical protein
MKIHRRKSALFAALIMAIGLAALPLEGAAIVIRDPIHSPPQAGDPDGPTPNQVKWIILWAGPVPLPMPLLTRATRAASQASPLSGRATWNASRSIRNE